MTSRVNADRPVSDFERIPNGKPASLLAPVWRILDSALATLQNRLDLLRTEAKETEVRFVEMFLLASAIAIFGTLALSVTTFVLVLLVWRDGPLIALTALIIAYAFAAAWAGSELKKRLNAPPPFETTADELRKDRECIARQEKGSRMYRTSTVSELLARKAVLRADADNLRAELSRHCAAVRPVAAGFEIAASAMRVAKSMRRLRESIK